MRSFTKWLLVPAALIVAACGGSDKPADDGLKNDLALASQVQPFQAQQFMSPTEQGLGPNGYQYPQPYPTGQGGYYPQPQQAQPVYYPQPRPRATVRRVPASTRGRTSSGGGVYSPAPARREPIRNTKRDAAIGAVAGGVLGAAVSRDRVKGAVIGAVAGGVLGGIIGHTIDVKHPQ
ncbi:MAG TPA: YMGG-like glycine zipper-containing protein [Vicinamibacterales bacterium]|nr:YMGG-like glycine zipper-containing protein [Vicinamibacterales bacterium]